MIDRPMAYVRRSYRAYPGSWTQDGAWLAARLPLRHTGGQVYELETAFRLDEEPPAEPPSTDAALAALLLPAMRRRRMVRLPGPLDSTLRGNLPRLQRLYAEFFADSNLGSVPVRAARAVADGGAPAGGRRVGVFMSLGVDSFCSLLSHLEEVDDLILVRGFEIELDAHRDELWNRMVAAGRDVAEAHGKRFIEARTNLRPFLRHRRIPWSMGHGAALAHVALLLKPWLGTVYVPSTFDTDNLHPWGSHPDLDVLWSAEDLEIRHDGEELNRLEKVHRIADFPVAMRHLRVCNRSPSNLYNCGRCKKCLPTMLALETAGALERCATFGDEVPAFDVKVVPDWGPHGRIFLAEIPAWWRENDPDHEMLPLVEEILGRPDQIVD